MADNLTTFICWLSWNLGPSNSWNPQVLSRPVTGIALPFIKCIGCLNNFGGAFTQLRKLPIDFVMSVHLHVSVQLPLDRFKWNLILVPFMEVFGENLNLVTLRHFMWRHAFCCCWWHLTSALFYWNGIGLLGFFYTNQFQQCCNITLFLRSAMRDMAARRKGTIVPSTSQIAALHNQLLPTAEMTLVFATGCISNTGVSAEYAHGNTSI